jgi:tetratricopeptide (TPR) repeat protein
MVRRSGSTQYSVAELVTKAEALVDQCQPDLAVQFYERALKQEPNNSALLDAVGELSTELDNPERALQVFQQSAALAPAQNPSKWFYLSQLVAGEEAEKYATQGVTFLKQELERVADQASDEAAVIKKQICDAYCALGELYMTDLCDHDQAEARCEAYFTEAMKFDVGLPEPTQALANLRLTQQRKDEALALLEETYRRLNDNCDEHSLPPLEFRIFTGKLLIEVEQYEAASDVLEGVMQEDDENAEIWFLVGTCYRAMDDLANALEFFEKCGQMLTKLKRDLRDEFHLGEQLESVEQTVAEIRATIASRPADEEDDDDDDDDDDDTGDDRGTDEDVDMED